MECPKKDNITETERIFESCSECCNNCPEFTYSGGLGQCNIIAKKEDENNANF